MSETPAGSPAITPVEPFYFGPRSARLYGCYHEPAAWPAREVGLVVCYPVGQEYLRSHRACLHLASAAARAGFPALRFDYFGTGDSAGDPDALELARWTSDVALAVEELRARSGVGPVVLAGLRLGASLALRAAPQVEELAGLVLWEPVVSGSAWLDELAKQHHAAIQRFHSPPRSYVQSARPAELLGFPVGDRMRESLEKLDLMTVKAPRAKPMLLVDNHGGADQLALAAQLQANSRFSHEHVPSFVVWTDDVDKGLVPSQVITAIVAWLERVFV